MRDTFSILITGLILFFVGFGVYLNYQEQRAVDRSKIPEKVEESKGFQRWITNLKNKGFIIEADEFRLIEENEIYNTKWMTIKSVDKEGVREEYEKIISEKLEDKNKVVFSQSERHFIDYKHEYRDGYAPNEIHYYGLRDDKIIDARILDCSADANCYFDRAYFLPSSNDVFIISEISRNIDKDDESGKNCSGAEICTYTFKIHVIDLINNSRLVYESEPFDVVLNEVTPEL